MSILSNAKPVTGEDLALFAVKYNLKPDVIADMFCVRKTKINKILSSKEPIENVTIALMLRIYDTYPYLILNASVQKFYDQIGGESVLRKRHLGVICGVNGSAGSRWIDKNKPAARDVIELVKLIAKLPNGLAEHKLIVNREATARGVNPWKAGSWTQPGSISVDNPEGQIYRKREPKSKAKTKEVLSGRAKSQARQAAKAAKTEPADNAITKPAAKTRKASK